MKIVVAFVALALGAPALAGAVTGAAEADRSPALEAARAAYLRFDYAEAERQFREALRRTGEGKAVESLAELADVLFVLGRDAEAEQAYRRVLERSERRWGAESARPNRMRWALFAVCTAREDFKCAGAFFRAVVAEPSAPALASVVLTPAADLARGRVLSGFPIKYSEAIHRRTLRLQEARSGAGAAAAPAQALASVFREQKREEALRALAEHFASAADVSRTVGMPGPAQD